MHWKQRQVLDYLSAVDQASLDDIYAHVSFSYFANYKKHLGAIMSRLVNAGKVERIKPGLFKSKVKFQHPRQLELFNQNKTEL